MIDFKIIVEKIYHIAEYKPGSGAKCPLCNEWNSPNNTGIKIKNGTKYRYHKCSNCGLKYKSVELISTSTD